MIRFPTSRRARARAPAATFVLALLLLLAASGGAGAPSAGPLRMVWWTDVGFPTPFAASTLGPGGVVRLSLIYDTLVWKDHTGVIPWLAESWRVSGDGRRWTFTLRPGVVWHDGRSLTARDVQFAFEYYRVHPFVWVDTSVVTEVTADGPHTVTFVLRQAFAPFLEDIVGIVPIVPAHVWEGVADPRKAQGLGMAIGSGPYRLTGYRPGAGEYRLEANRRYFRGRPRFDEIQYTVVPAERQLLAVQSGQSDVAMADTYDVVHAFAGHPYLRVWQSEPLSVARLLFNLERPPFGQKAARQAVAYGVNRTQLATLVTRGPGVPGSPGMVPPTDRWYNPRVRAYPYDPSRARSLVAQAGPAPLSFELLASPSPVVPVVQEMLRGAGIEATVRTVDARTRAALIAEGKYQAALTFHIGAGGDPDYLRRWLGGGEANLFGQSEGFAHPEFQRLAAEQARSVDQVARRTSVYRMQDILADELPTLALYYRRFYWVYDSRKFTPIATAGGLMNGIPLIENKLAFLGR